MSDDVTITRYASAMIRGAVDVANQHSHTVLIAETGGNRERALSALDAMLDHQPDGIIFGSMAARRIRLPEIPTEVPLVLLNATSDDGRPSVLPAEHEAGYRLTRHLLGHGHRRVGLIGNPEHGERNSATIGDRFDGIHQAFAEAGLDLTVTVDEDEWEPHRGYEATRTLLEADEPITALIALNDRLAFGAYQRFQDHGLRIPDDISIVSFDDDEVASYLRPGLTTAKIPYEEMGRQAMEMLLNDPDNEEHRLVPMPLKIRDSVRDLDRS